MTGLRPEPIIVKGFVPEGSNPVNLCFLATGAGALPLVDYWFLLCGLCVRGQVIQFALFFFIYHLALALATIGLLFVGPQIILNQEMFIWLAASAIEAWEAITPSFRRVRAVIQGPDFALRVRRWRRLGVISSQASIADAASLINISWCRMI